MSIERPPPVTSGIPKPGNHYADQRYISPGCGRFVTPDRNPSPRLAAPGSWDRYAYTRGDPVNRRDPSGRDDCGDDGEEAACAYATGYTLSIEDDEFDTEVEEAEGLPLSPCYGESDDLSDLCVAWLGSAFGISVTQAGIGPANANWVTSAQNGLAQFATVVFAPSCDDFLEQTLHIALYPLQLGADSEQIVDGTMDNNLAGPSLATRASGEYYRALQAQFQLTANRATLHGNSTIAQWLAADPGIMAISTLGGNSIFVNSTFPADLTLSTYTIFHEMLHSAGFNDQELESAWGIPNIKGNTTGITERLMEECPFAPY